MASDKMPAVCEPPDPRASVTLLTGFLGAGKTSRLNALLTAGQEKVAVIENEIGAIGVDGNLVANHHEDGVIELVNGCLCCSAEVDLVAALEALANRRAERPFDRILIETTGLADVAPVISLLSDETDPLAESLAFAGVVTVVDALGVQRWSSGETPPQLAWASGFGTSQSTVAPSGGQINAGHESARLAFWRQVAFADRLVISKADLVGEEILADVKRLLLNANPLAEVIVDAMKGEVTKPSALEPLQSRRIDAAVVQERAATSSKRFCSAHAKQRIGHLKGVDVITLQLWADRPMHADRFEAFAKSILEGLPHSTRGTVESVPEAWRLKGVLSVVGRGFVLVQGVHDHLSLEDWPHSHLASGPFLVVVGTNLQSTDLQELCLD